MVIDHCLQNKGGYSTSEIMEAVNRELEERGEEPVTASNTIRTDIDFIANNWHTNIIEKKEGRRRFYMYEDPSFSISKSPLSESELNQLNQTLQMLGRYSGMPSYEWLDNLNARFKTQFFTTAETSSFVGFDNNEYVTGMEFFDTIFNAIAQKETLKITYRSFNMKEPSTATVSPYYLKQYNNRWFLFGGIDDSKQLTIYALDRILEVTQAHTIYNPSEIDFSSYFEDIIGVSIPKGQSCEKVQLWVSAEQFRYIQTKPIHGSQRVIETSSNGAIIELDIIPNYELEQLLLSYGEKIKVLSPESLRDRMKERISKSFKNYE